MDATTSAAGSITALNELVQRESAFVEKLTHEASKVIVGQHYLVDRVLIGMLTGGHVLLEGVPGLAKTLTINTIADAVAADFKRLQFTPDLLPADLIGTMVYTPRTGEFTVRKGPIFANIVLADEINRAPAKVQSALLEAMQEKQVTIGEETFKLPRPFFVMATQNPIEQEGTYPLPEAQVDRFMLKVQVGYPSRSEERLIMDRMSSSTKPSADETVTPEELLAARKVVEQVYIDDKLKEYIIDIVCCTRAPGDYGLNELTDLVEHGASPRATIALNMAARAHAFLRHRGFVTPEDIKSVGLDVLRHRIILTYEAEAEEIRSEDVIRKIFDTIEVP